MVRDRFAVLDDIGDDVLAEIVARIRVRRVALQEIDEEGRLEHIDAHAAERDLRFAGHGRRILGLFEEGNDPVLFIDMHDAEAPGFFERSLEAADGDVRA